VIWVVSKGLVSSEGELNSRHQVIQEIAQAKVSPWSEYYCRSARWPYTPFGFYQCVSQKGEYGLMVTAHMNIEVQPILQQVLSSKRALVVINSCEIRKGAKDECYRIMASKNPHSEMFFAKQEISDSGYLINYMENAGAFGFQTTTSERELFQQRRLGLVNAIRVVYDKVVPE